MNLADRDAHFGCDLSVGVPCVTECSCSLGVEVEAGAAETNPTTTGTFKSCTSPFRNLTTLLFPHPAEDRDEQPAYGAGRVEPGFANRDDLNPKAVKFHHRLHGPHHASMKAIEAPQKKDSNLPFVRRLHHGLELGPALHGRDVLRVRLGDGQPTGFGEPHDVGQLVLGILGFRRDAEICDCVHKTYYVWR